MKLCSDLARWCVQPISRIITENIDERELDELDKPVDSEINTRTKLTLPLFLLWY
jgi:hypothetical protein